MSKYLLAIDQGTTNSRAILFSREGRFVAQQEYPLTQYYPQPGWVEQNPDEMLDLSLQCCRVLFEKVNIHPREVIGVGITNQRETTIMWDKKTGRPVHPAIVWQDRRTKEICQELKTTCLNTVITQKTGLLIDPYFSATKILWLFSHIPTLKQRAEQGEVLFGTIDSYFLWHLTRGQVHATDITNASRTMLYNIHSRAWDKEILSALEIPEACLPRVLDNTAHFGDIADDYFGYSIPILAMAGDQQAATVGQACIEPGMAKMTFGTGGFLLLNTGSTPVVSRCQLLTTIAYQMHGQTCYGLEGSIFSAGSTIKWLRDELGVIQHPNETEALADSIETNEGVYLVPAFTGLGAPYWNPEVRGALLGLSRNSGKAHLVRAALESVCYQTADLLDAMIRDVHSPLKALRVDGGMAANSWVLQFLSNLLRVPVERPIYTETTALGAALMAGLQAGIFSSLSEMAKGWELSQVFTPEDNQAKMKEWLSGWQSAVRALTCSHSMNKTT